MKQTLQLRVSQHLALTPQLQQSIRLLQLSTLELNQEIDQFLQDNPLLEREDAERAPGEVPARHVLVVETAERPRTRGEDRRQDGDAQLDPREEPHRDERDDEVDDDPQLDPDRAAEGHDRPHDR